MMNAPFYDLLLLYVFILYIKYYGFFFLLFCGYWIAGMLFLEPYEYTSFESELSNSQRSSRSLLS